MLSSVWIGNEENDSRGRCHDFRFARAAVTLPLLTSENQVGYGALIGQQCVACLNNTIATV